DVDRETVTIGRLAVEAHHVQAIASRAAGSLCTDNILLLCPNCHRRVHHDPTVVISTTESSIQVRTDGTILTIPKNTMSFLLERLLHHATQT
ncbi:MAG: HNH endonuclease, partial [Planctomyces sp.]